MDMQSKRGKALSVVTAATLAASLGVPAVAIAEEVDQATAAQETAYQRGNVVDEMLAGQSEQPVEGAVATVDGQSYATLSEAIAAAKNGGVVKVQRNLTADQVTSDPQNPYILIAEQGTNVTIDLNKHSIQLDAADAIAIQASDVTLKIVNGSIENAAANGYGLYVYDNKAAKVGYDNVNVIFEGVTLTTKDQAIGVQGNNSNNNVTLKNCVINANKSLGAYWPPKSGLLTLDGTTINAGTGLMVKGGQIKVLGDTVINADGDQVIPEDFYNGDPNKSIDLTGDAVYMESGYNDRAIVVNIESGTFNSKNNLAVRYFTKPTQTAPERKYNITGGNFSSELSVEYVGAGAAMLVSEDGRAAVMAEDEAEKQAGAYVEKDGKKVYYTSEKAAQDANPDKPEAVVSYRAQVGDAKYATLAEAVAAAQSGATVTMLDNVEVAQTVEVSKNLKIDLAGKTIKGNDVRAFLVKGGKLELAGEGIVTSVKPEGGKLDESSSVIRVGDNGGDAGRDASLVIGKDVTVKAPNTYGVSVFGAKTAESVDVHGKILATGTASAISGNGSAQYAGTTIVLHDGSEVTATDAAAIYHPQAGALTIEGATIKGLTGIELKGGEATVEIGGNTKVEATGEISHGENNNGTSSSGYAVAVVENKNYAGAAKVKIAAGDFVGDVAILADNEVAADKKGSIAITGGTFTKDPTAFVVDGYKASESNGKWTVSEIVPPAPPAPNPQPEPQPETDVEQRPDGSTVTTVTQPDGSQTVTTESADGSQSVVSKDAEGNVTSTEVTVSDEAAQAGEVVLPLEPSKPAAGSEKPPAVEVKVPASVTAEAPVKVTVPVEAAEEPNYGVVVYAVDAEGNEVLLPKCGVDAEGNAVFEAAGDVTVKVVDASPSFPDTAGEWYGEDGTADFVGARGILTGVPQADGALAFDGDAPTTRAMFVTMLHRAESKPSAPEAGFGDMDGSEWYAAAAAWGEATGVVNGYGDGAEFGGDDPVTREQMAMFAMRYAKHLGLDVSGRADLSAFPDGGQASDWASEALSWAVHEGLLRGHADGTGRLDPQGGATRAETAAVVMRFINGLYA